MEQCENVNALLKVFLFSSAGAEAMTNWLVPLHSFLAPSCCDPKLYTVMIDKGRVGLQGGPTKIIPTWFLTRTL